MIQLLATRYRKWIAFCFFHLFYMPAVLAAHAEAHMPAYYRHYYGGRSATHPIIKRGLLPPVTVTAAVTPAPVTAATGTAVSVRQKTGLVKKDIGGPSQPEMSSFKSVGTDNMVNLFTGDFNYNIPLLDVGGYPVNLFYDGGTGVEQEASWVGLNWNINPGNVSRSMRGVPDDFNGEDTLVQQQNTKPNKTWGITLAGDLEGVGLKDMFSFGVSLGLSFNNYLGPAFDLGIKGGANFKIADKVKAEKDGATDSLGLKMGVNVSANIGSRSGFTLSPGVSLTAGSFLRDRSSSFGIGLSTSYNSRSGIKELQINEQMSFSRYREKAEKNKQNSSSIGASIFATSISFAKPSYIPSIRMPLSNDAISGHFQLGGAIFGVYGSVEVEAYQQTSKVSPEKIVQKKPLVGYLYYQAAMDNPNAVMDFTRFNDKEVTAHTPVISAPQYSYDVFSIQGEGTGGSIRAYRNDLGYVRDNATGSQDRNTGIGVDIGIPGHFGANVNLVKTPTTIGEWSVAAGNKLHTPLKFQGSGGSTWENVYFRNPGEASVLNPDQYTKIGGVDLVRFELSGNGYSPAVETMLDRFTKTGASNGSVNASAANLVERKKRSQVINFLTAADASLYGLDKMIKSYSVSTILDASNNLVYDSILRVSGFRKKHHISEIDVTEANGKRYIYGIPVYNIRQKDFTFSVSNTEINTTTDVDKVIYADNETSTDAGANPNLSSSGKDGYIQITETPAYAHSFLLSGLLSPDYVDVTGNGITEDDLGDAVKFNYTRIGTINNPTVYKWRTPTGDHKANFNAGNRSDAKDDKGIVSYGERESWYLHSIESKTMVALFTLQDRTDGKSVSGENGGIVSDNALKCLKQIDLYNKSDLKKNGLAKAKPIKTVHFVYSYTLCQAAPDNPSGTGRLTLDGIYFTFNGQERANKNKYVFSYTNSDGTGNPGYAFGASDRWGTYKPASMNPGGMRNSEYPYTPQDPAQKAALDQNAAAWSLKKILLPSGGQLEVQYESDDYAFVQNRRATDMMSIAGFGSSATAFTNKLYDLTWSGLADNNYVFINVPQPCTSPADVLQKYLQGISQLAVKLTVQMPKGPEHLTSYATIADYGVYDASKIWVKLNTIDGMSPLSLTALEYLREQLPGQAYPGYDVSESSGLQQVGDILAGMWYGLKNAFSNPVDALRRDGKAQLINLSQSFVRLNDPDGIKYGGGQRVKSIKLKDNWSAMTGQYTSAYGQEYTYTTTEIFNGAERTISSGVASYEPSIGSDENPFQTIVMVSNKLPMGPASYGSVEMPVLDAFFPAPVVGYSKVTVRSLPSVTPPAGQKSRSGVGRQVTEYYTAKDFPVYFSNTSLDPGTDKQAHTSSTTAFFYKYAFDSRALSQGFLVETNDMHGKLKSQSSYAENDPKLLVNYTANYYRNTGANGMQELFDFAYASQGGVVNQGNMGIDVELMTDVREFTVKSNSLEIQAQVDLFPVIFPFWLPFIWPVAGNSENNYRAVTTTKVVNYHSVLDSMVVIDKGSQVSTKNLVYDAETGEVLVTRTNNEFNQPLYNTNYPAWWAYSGMGPSYKNTGYVYSGVNFYQGKITNAGFDQSNFESGDELYITSPGAGATGCVAASGNVDRLWIFDKNKNSTALTVPVKDLVFMDQNGGLFSKNGVSFKIIRSGRRNMLDAKAGAVTSMVNPVSTGTPRKLALGNNSKVINATAVEFREKWQTDNDVIKKFSRVPDPSNCGTMEIPDCLGYPETSINPYLKGLVGNFRPSRNMVFYNNRTESDPAVATNLPQNGFLANFKLYWDFNASNNLVPDAASTQWVWNTQITRVNARGLELENVNALNIYTSAQYGFNKTMPVAIANNARYNEMLYEGFEDNGFANNLNITNATNCSNDHHIDFTTMANASVVNMDSLGITAHTGKYALAVNANTTATKTIGLTGTNIAEPNFVFISDSTSDLNDPGGLVLNKNFFPVHAPGFPNYEQGSRFPLIFNGVGLYNTIGSDTWMYDSIGPTGRLYSGYFFSTRQYFKITSCRNYTLSAFVEFSILNPCDNDASVHLTVSDLDGNVLQELQCGDVVLNCTNNGNGNCYYRQNASNIVFLPPGIYTLDADVQFYHNACTETLPDDYGYGFDSNFSYGIDAPGTSYKSLRQVANCRFIRPLAADASTVNPDPNTALFNAGKKMVFSAWVRESCGNPANGTPCTSNSYTNNQVQLQLDDGTNATLTPSGPIVDGWQRYEGYFTPSASATGMNINFVNNSGSTIYFDDIRIHPFNANMKSYVYDPVSLRLVAELDDNNYASFYEYDEEGTLIRTKVETRQGIKTIKETRSAKQKNITTVQ